MTSIANQKHDVYTDELLRIIRYAGLLMPVLIVFLGLATKYGIFDNSYYHSDVAFWLIITGFMAAGVWQLYTTKYGERMQSFNLALYHVLSYLLVIFVTGFSNPVIICWIIVAVVADILFGRKAYFLSILSLVALAWLHLARQEVATYEEIFYVGSIVVTIAAIGFIISFLQDVSDNERLAFHRSQKQEILQRDRLMTLINAMNDAVISTDSKGVIRVYNAATLNLLDTNKTLSGQSINSILNLYDEQSEPANLIKQLKDTPRTILRDLSHKFDDGEMINLSISIAPINPTYHQKTQHGFIFVLRDITKEKSLEEERDEFISVVSHELRTPIAIAEGNLSNVKFLLERGDQGSTLTGAIDGAHDQIMYLARMINDLSTLSRAERGVADEPEDIDINTMIEALYSEYRPQAEAKKLALNLDLHGKIGTVSASKLYLEEVIQNFITNAIKYTHEGSVTLGARKVADNQVELFVKDTGIGMSKADQKHIFEKFYRSEDYRTRETNGTGLGLYVVHKLTQKLKIKIEFKSRLNHGSTFSFKMPLQK